MRTLSIQSFSSSSSALALASTDDLVLQPNSTQVVPVRFAPTEERDELATFVLASKDGCADQFVQVRAASVFPALVLDPTSLDFGPVEPPNTVERSLIVHNRTTRPATLSDLLAMAPFSVVTTGPSLVPPRALGADGVWRDGELTLTLRFTPASLGPSSSQLTFRSSFVAQPVLAVPLRGLGGSRRLFIDSPLEFGKVPLFTGAQTAATRAVRLRSGGSLPVSLSLPVVVTAGNPATSATELCVGALERATNRCSGHLPRGVLTAQCRSATSLPRRPSARCAWCTRFSSRAKASPLEACPRVASSSRLSSVCRSTSRRTRRSQQGRRSAPSSSRGLSPFGRPSVPLVVTVAP